MTAEITAGGASPTALSPAIEQLIRERVEACVAELKAKEKRRTKRMALIATKGTLDFAYPPLILASTAASLGWEVGIFFTFYGLNIIHKDKKLRVAPLANPAMPMPVPNMVGAVPGMTGMATTMMKRMFRQKGVASIDDLLTACRETGVRMIPCQMTADVFGYDTTKDFVEGAEQACGAATFVRFAADADVSLFI